MIHFYRHSGIYRMETEQYLPISLDTAWGFFSDPQNLQRITPKEMGFEITSDLPSTIFPGQIITYRVGIFPFIKSNWVTEITHVAEPAFFVDEQRFDPYQMWHHEHHFQQTSNGVLMKDRVSYKLPFAFLGRWAHHFFVKKQLLKIFVYRQEVLERFFSSY
ncbi:MAG: SRPBCC family protein [Bacteroidales bacterium]